MAILIPEFPSETHIAMWRLGAAIRELGVKVIFLSTRRPVGRPCCHTILEAEAMDAFYAWPPSVIDTIGMVRRPRRVLDALRYIAKLNETPWLERVSLLGMLPAAASIRSICAKNGIEHVLVHSCGNSAHLASLCRTLGGPPFSLRLGGDLQVYGREHCAKMKECTFVIAAALNNCEEVHQKVGLSADRVFWTWLGVDTERFSPGSRGTAYDCLKIITVARLNRTKGHTIVLSAIRRLVERNVPTTYTIIGSGAEREAICAEARLLGLERNVILKGALDESVVIDELRRHDVFVLASIGKGEASPVALLEAMSCGLCTIATRIGGVPRIIEDNVDGMIVPQDDPEAITNALWRVWQEPGLLQRLGDAARAKALKEFDCASVAKAILDRMNTAL